MRLNETVGSAFDALEEPTETYREGCFSYHKWFFDTDSKDIKWIVMRREFVTLNEQVFEWLEKFPISETIRLEAKRLVFGMKYEDYMNHHFSNPVLIALCSLRLACELHSVNFNSLIDGCMNVAKRDLKYKKIQAFRLSNPQVNEYIKRKSIELREVIGEETIEGIKRMWGCIDEAKLLA